MIIDYDRRPNATTDEKLQSLKENIQMALNEITINIETLQKQIKEIEEAIGD